VKLLKSEKGRYIVEHSVINVLSLIFVVRFYFQGDIIGSNIVLFYLILLIAVLVFFRIMKRKGRWYKYKEYVPTGVSITFLVLMFGARTMYRMGSAAIDASVILMLVMIILYSSVNYYFNFKKP